MGYTQLENRLRDRCVEHICNFLSTLDHSVQPEEKYFVLIDRIFAEIETAHEALYLDDVLDLENMR